MRQAESESRVREGRNDGEKDKNREIALQPLFQPHTPFHPTACLLVCLLEKGMGTSFGSFVLLFLFVAARDPLLQLMSGAAAQDGDAGCAQGAEMGFQDETNGITSAFLLLLLLLLFDAVTETRMPSHLRLHSSVNMCIRRSRSTDCEFASRALPFAPCSLI